MHVAKISFAPQHGLQLDEPLDGQPDIVLYFGARKALASCNVFSRLATAFPRSIIVGCSTASQIQDYELIDDDQIACVGLKFAKTTVRLSHAEVPSMTHSRSCGRNVGAALRAADLAGVFVLSDGLNVNGSELIRGISEEVEPHVVLTGGLAGDGASFQETLVGANGPPQAHQVAAIGFYGDAVRIGHGSAGGWDVFGPWRRITRATSNVLLELDTEPALDLYERYLAEEAAGLPGTGLLFPLQIQNPTNAAHCIVRTILAVDRKTRSVTFAGNVPEGWLARLMRGNMDRLAAGAAEAARQARRGIDCGGLALLVSCVGRHLLMGQHTSDELEAVASELGHDFRSVGFYSYGEISPHALSGVRELHNQTMTITTIGEVAV
ncbi:FIST signal transduction protein [Bradyrhizobium oligotrophicum]|uniref:FIST signal transduction protein n=1 Tax=Bradyrhizobium oligotrophicum TaxID=44255 RepID=UPI003EBF0701